MTISNITNIPAAGKFEDVSQVRVLLYQNGRVVHAALTDLLSFALEGTGLLEGIILSGDMQIDGDDLIRLSGDATGYLLTS